MRQSHGWGDVEGMNERRNMQVNSKDDCESTRMPGEFSIPELNFRNSPSSGRPSHWVVHGSELKEEP